MSDLPLIFNSIYNSNRIIPLYNRIIKFSVNSVIQVTTQQNGEWAQLKMKPLEWTALSQLGLVTQSCPTLCDPMDCTTPGFPIHHQLPELTQTHGHRVGDASQPSHPLLSPFPPAFPASRSFPESQFFAYQVAKVLELQIQDQSFQWIFRTDLL